MEIWFTMLILDLNRHLVENPEVQNSWKSVLDLTVTYLCAKN